MPSTFPRLAKSVSSHWTMDPDVVFLNHGSFGACPRPILTLQREWQDRMEREPVLFLGRQLEGLLDEARSALAAFVGAEADDLAFVPNATAGVNTVLRSVRLQPGDEILVTNHEYNATRNAAVAVAERTGARVVVAEVPFPLQGDDEVLASVTAQLTPRTRLVVVDHVTSQTGLILPVARLARECQGRGIDTLVDGAHAPGMLPLDLRALGEAGVSWYTGNCHKWLCTPKGSALLWARRDRQEELLPLGVSHGFNATRTDRSRFRLLFDWGGTDDPTAFLCVPAAIRFLEGLVPGGIQALRDHNHRMACAGRELLCTALGIPAPAPERMLGSLAAVPLPAALARTTSPTPGVHPLQERLFQEHRIEVPVMPWPQAPRWNLRISAQAYNEESHYRALAAALRA